MFVEQERALNLRGGDSADRGKPSVRELLAASPTNRLTTGWSDARLAASMDQREVDDFHKVPT